jgi:hypothetical protein
VTLWQWALVALCAAGAALALVSSATALVAIVRLNRRLTQLRESPFVTKLESLQIQLGRFARISDDVERLRARAEKAVQTLRSAPKGFAAMAGAWRDCALQLRNIVSELS